MPLDDECRTVRKGLDEPFCYRESDDTCADYEMIHLAVRRQERKSSAEKLGHVAALLSEVGTGGIRKGAQLRSSRNHKPGSRNSSANQSASWLPAGRVTFPYTLKAIMNTFAGVRLGLWCWFYFCALLAWVLAAAFIGRTEDNFGLYAPSAVVVLVAGLLGNTLLPLCVFLSYARAKEWPFGSLIIEFTATFVVWALFLGGSAALSSKYSSWGWCFGSTCSLARSVEAWGWISWVTLTFLLIFIGIAGCIGPDKDDNTTAAGTGPNREVVGATEMGVHQQAPVSTGPQSAYATSPQTMYAGQPEPKGPAAPSAYATGNPQMQA